MSEQASMRGGMEALSRGVVPTVPPPRFHWGTRVLVPGAVVLGMALLLAAASYDSLMPATEVSALPVVELASVGGPARGSEIVRAAGWIEADPYLLNATALTSGIVREVLVLEGDVVEEGQVLARLIPEDANLALQRAEAEHSERRAMVADAEAHLEAARTEWENPVERDRAIAVAEAALRESRAMVPQTEADIRSAEADLERLRTDNARFAALGETDSVSESEVIGARTRMEAQAAQVESLHQRLETARAQVNRHEAELTAAREHRRLRTAEKRELASAEAALDRANAELQRAGAQLEEARLRVDRLEIRAPRAGVVVERLKEPGSKVMIDADEPRSATVATLYDPRKLQVRVDIPLADASHLFVGQQTEIVVDVLPNTTFHGTVTRILHIADIQKNTLQVKVAIKDPSPLLRPEMLAAVRFLSGGDTIATEVSGGRLHLHRDALNGDTVWVVENYNGTKGSAATRKVSGTSTTSGEGWVAVENGLRPGDLAILRPPTGLKPGARLRVTIASAQGGN